MSAARPVLVTGTHRSGSTWVGRTLEQAAGFAYVDEPFHPAARPGVCDLPVERWYEYVSAEDDRGFAAPVERLLRWEYGYAAELAAVRSPRDAGRLVRDAARFADRRRRGARALVKDPIALLSAPWLAERFGMQVVLLARHPAAFASSVLRVGWHFDMRQLLDQPQLVRDHLGPWLDVVEADVADDGADLLAHAARCWTVLMGLADAFATAHPDWVVVRHEDLSRDPVAGFAQLAAQLGAQLDDDGREVVRRLTDSSNPTEAEEGAVHTLARDSRANVWSWRDRLDAAQVDRVRELTAEVWPRFYADEDWGD